MTLIGPRDASRTVSLETTHDGVVRAEVLLGREDVRDVGVERVRRGDEQHLGAVEVAVLQEERRDGPGNDFFPFLNLVPNNRE